MSGSLETKSVKKCNPHTNAIAYGTVSLIGPEVKKTFDSHFLLLCQFIRSPLAGHTNGACTYSTCNACVYVGMCVVYFGGGSARLSSSQPQKGQSRVY